MADYTLGPDELAIHAKTLAANIVDTVTFGRNVDQVTVLSDGSADLYYTLDGSTPTVAGPRTYRLPAGGLAVDERVAPRTVDVVKLISAGTPTYSVQS